MKRQQCPSIVSEGVLIPLKVEAHIRRKKKRKKEIGHVMEKKTRIVIGKGHMTDGERKRLLVES